MLKQKVIQPNQKMKVEDIKNIANPILEAKNLFLVDLKISGDNVIELYIDALTGVNIQTCIEISREIESHFNRDEEDFELTVSSAGIGYPFKVEKQYQKNLEKNVEITTKDNRKLNGILKSFDQQSITIEYEEKRTIAGKKKKKIVKTKLPISREDIKEIKDEIKF